MKPFSREVSHDGRIYPITGFVDPHFAAVAEAFAANFAAGEEVGAAVAVTVEGRPVVDLWGGYTNATFDHPWQEDTIVNMMSVAKGVAALCIHMLADRHLLDVAAPVATYWPEFAAAGKEALPLRFVLDHRAGLPYLTGKLPRGSAYEAHAIADALARQAPVAPPGTDPQYHVMTQGYILGEIVRRVSGKTLGSFLREEIAVPLGLDYAIGLSETDQLRCANFLLASDNRLLAAIRAPDTPESIFWAQLSATEDFNSHAWRSAEIPSANGHGNPRAIARLYGALACGGEVDGVRLIGDDALARMTAEQHHLPERLVGRHYHQALGVVLNSPPVSYMGPNPLSFGHQGAGGAHGFADPGVKLGFSYAPNQFKSNPAIPTRHRLIDATFAALG
ncbi:serine hydrolase domain-containing protein [Paraburkholderia caffeinilytica]|uniref:serine hydrolase domain-containing protein n=1 Tax=Paraburkholderia caffeinilytica TaxID=1761016 RepID=UPI003DA0E62F